MNTPEEFEAHPYVKAIRHDMARLQKSHDDLRLRCDRAENDAQIGRYAVLGMCFANIQLRIDPIALAPKNFDNAHMAKLMGENAAHQILRSCRVVFQEQARMFSMREHIARLENTCLSYNIKFRKLGEDNYGYQDIWSADYQPPPYLFDSVMTKPKKPEKSP